MDGMRVEAVLEGRFGLDGGAMFGIIPRPLWEKTNPPDALNRIELGARCMLIRHPEAGNILVDVGIGTRWTDKERGIYDVRHADADASPLGLEAGLARVGLGLGDIDHVLLTHLHFDHAGGLARWGEGGALTPTFAGKPHYVLREHWAWAWRPTERDAGSFRKDDFGFLERGDTPLHLLDGYSEPFRGVTLIPRYGHTHAMACVKVDAQDATYLYLADLIPTLGHLRVPYVMGYDLNPVVTCREKRELLSEAARQGWKLFFEHDPHTATCRVEDDGRGGWRQVPHQG